MTNPSRCNNPVRSNNAIKDYFIINLYNRVISDKKVIIIE